MLRTLGVEHAVLVQPSVYMTDNSAMLDALIESDFSLRGVAVVTETVTDAELRRMHEAGVRGLRLNLRFENGASAAAAPLLAKRVAPFGWHLQFRINSGDFVEMKPLLESLPVDIVIDHIGQVPVEDGVRGNAFQIILALVRSGRCWVKLSAPMRMSRLEFPHSDVTPFVQALVETRPDRMVWATDWPHTTITGKIPNDGDLVDLLTDWIPDVSSRHQVLVDNLANLYGF